MADEESTGEPAEGITGQQPEAEAGGAGPGLTEEEMAMLEQQMRELTVDDLLTQTVVSVLNLTARRIGKEDEIDLDQARTGIDAVRALLPLLPEEIAKEIREPLSQIQMLYASRSGEGPQDEPSPEGAGGKAEGTGDTGQDAPGSKDRPDSGLWTPPGS